MYVFADREKNKHCGGFVGVGIVGRAYAGTTGKITGQVTDEEGNPLPGAAVILEGTKRGTETDVEGIYLLLSVDGLVVIK